LVGGRESEGRAAELSAASAEIGIRVRVETFDRSPHRSYSKTDLTWHQLFTQDQSRPLSVTVRYHTNQIKKAPFVNGWVILRTLNLTLFDKEFIMAATAKHEVFVEDIQKI
jgi:hypothetical protein